jgi:NADPH:quinone reductase
MFLLAQYSGDFMRAIQMAKTGGPEVLEYVEVPKPELKAGQVLVRVRAIGVGKPDVLVRTGVYKWMPSLPTTPGVEATGHIAEIRAGYFPTGRATSERFT